MAAVQQEERQMVFTTRLVDDATDKINDGVVVKRYQNPWLKSEVGLRRAGVTFKMTQDEQQEYIRCALDVHYFVEKYCKVKREDGSVGNIFLRDYQKEILDNFVNSRFNILMASRQVGKAQDLDSIVWDINGKKRFGDLKLGDQIYGDDGELTCVTGIYPQGVKDIYEIEFSDGTTARSCDEHLWTVIDYMGYEKTLQLKDIMTSLKSERGDYKYYVKMNEPVNYPEKDLEMDPYLLGIILGDGSITQKVVKLSNTDKEVIDYLYTLEDDDIKISRVGETCDYNISRTSPKIRNKYKLILEELNLMGKSSSDKFIPKEYLTGSITQRISLLQGLMDTDGGSHRNRPEYNTVSKQLSEDFRELCHSLGIKTSVVKKKRYYTYKEERKIGKDCYKVRLYLRNGYKYPIFRIKRKQELIKDKKFDWGYKRGIESVKYISKKEAQCIEVDNITRLYLTDNYIPTHNTISSAIFMLHKILFDNDKNIMIVANKGDTAVEIVDKIKSIYSLLPFFLKPGIKTWNQKSLTFENGCRIKTSARTKTPAIGFTIDVLYLDEFAHIPSNVIEPYYTAAFPTTAAVQNSKIIITSTPNGMNLFHRLLTDAERPDGDPQKNNYKAMRVYWYQVPGRFVTYLRLNPHKLHEHGFTKEDIFDICNEKWSHLTKVEMGYNSDLQRDIIYIYNNDVCSDEDVSSFHVIDSKGMEIPIKALSEVTTWKQEAIKDIGGEDAFNQEYGLRFINASKSLLNESIIDDLLKNKRHYQWEEIIEFERRLKFSYKDLKWVHDDELFMPVRRKDYKIVVSVDISEGLGQDYSVINIFRINNKSKELIDIQKMSYKSLVDFFKLEQIGIFRSNLCSVKQLAEFLYVLVFEYLNPENVKVVLELNNYGNTLLAEMPHVFDGNNDYGSSVFVRYKHRVDSQEEKVGLKVGENKNLLVKDYQDLMMNKGFFINNEDTIREITTFVKHTTTAGNIRYAADVGHDDCVMTIVNATSIFSKNEFKESCEEWMNKSMDKSMVTYINECMKQVDYTEGVDYGQLLRVRRQILGKNSINKGQSGNWFGMK